MHMWCKNVGLGWRVQIRLQLMALLKTFRLSSVGLCSRKAPNQRNSFPLRMLSWDFLFCRSSSWAVSQGGHTPLQVSGSVNETVHCNKRMHSSSSEYPIPEACWGDLQEINCTSLPFHGHNAEGINLFNLLSCIFVLQHKISKSTHSESCVSMLWICS